MFTAIALMTLAIGIGANTAVFSVVNGVLLKPLPYPDANRLIGVWYSAPGAGFNSGNLNVSPSMLFTYREQGRSFQEIGLWQPGSATVTGLAEPEQIRSLRMTHGTLDVLGVPPALGRWFTREDDTPGTPETVILMNGYWQRKFGADPSVIGRTLSVDSTPRVVIGVMPADFRFIDTDADMVLPMRFDRSRAVLGNFSYQGVARLNPGVTIEQANADVGRLLPIWLKSWPAPFGLDAKVFENARLAPALRPLKEDVVGQVDDILWVVMGTIGVVLLIACANVANLLLVRVEGRQQELATRAALGAAWSRIARELLHESLVLGLLGGVLGLGVAYGALRVLAAIGPESLPRLQEITIDPAVLGFALAASLLSGLLFGVIPVLKVQRTTVRDCAAGKSNGDSQSRTTPCAQRARRRAGRAGAGPADCLGTDDSDVPDPANRSARLHSRRTTADGESVATHYERARAGARGALAQSNPRGDGRHTGCGQRRAREFGAARTLRQQRSGGWRRQDVRGEPDPSGTAIQVRLSRVLSDRWHADRGRP